MFTEPPRSPKPTTDIAVRRANVLAALDLERARSVSNYFPPDPRFESIDRRLERLEAIVAELAIRLEEAA